MKENKQAVPPSGFLFPQAPMDRRSLLKWLVAASASLSFGGALEADASQPLNADQHKGTERQTVFIPPEARRHAYIRSNPIDFKLASEDTAGLVASAELSLESGILGAPPHLHHGFDEICRVLEGTVHVMVAGNVTAVPAGGWHLRPRGLIHTFWNAGPGRARFIELYVPGGHERYMNDLADLYDNGRQPRQSDLQALSKIHDIEFHFEQLDEVMKLYNLKL